LFYPQYVLVLAGILALRPWRWRGWRSGFQITSDPSEQQFCLIGLIAAVLVMLPYVLIASPNGPVITAAQAKLIPDFGADGRARFFLGNPWLFWLSGNRSGLFPTFKPPILAVGLLLPLLLRLSRQFPIARYITPNLAILAQMTTVALALFFAAHAFLFKLHLPSRYTASTLRFVLVFATALSLMLLVEAGLRWVQLPARPASRVLRRVLVWGAMLCFGGLLLFYPLYAVGFPDTGYEKGRAPALYQFLAQQPKDTLVASLLKEADNIPTFAKRSVLVAPEYAVPYHIGYADLFRQRAKALIQAQYSSNQADLRQFVQRYGVDFWLIDSGSFSPDSLKKQWVRQYPEALAIVPSDQAWVEQRSRQCTVVGEKGWRLLDVECLVK
jgi:hypothetical protein